jgi:hypothetical protein
MDELSPEEMLPPAEKLPAMESVEAARKQLSEDQVLALRMIGQAGENALANQEVAAPWEPGSAFALGRQLLRMVLHFDRHKSQPFYSLKLQGKPVDTADLCG